MPNNAFHVPTEELARELKAELSDYRNRYAMLALAVVSAGLAPEVLREFDELASGGFKLSALPLARQDLEETARSVAPRRQPKTLDWEGVFDEIEARREEGGAP